MTAFEDGTMRCRQLAFAQLRFLLARCAPHAGRRPRRRPAGAPARVPPPVINGLPSPRLELAPFSWRAFYRHKSRRAFYHF